MKHRHGVGARIGLGSSGKLKQQKLYDYKITYNFIMEITHTHTHTTVIMHFKIPRKCQDTLNLKLLLKNQQKIN